MRRDQRFEASKSFLSDINLFVRFANNEPHIICSQVDMFWQKERLQYESAFMEASGTQ